MFYATEQEDAVDSDTLDPDNEKFWKEIGHSFQLAMELLYEFAEEQGIDLDNLDTESVEVKEREARKKAEEHPAAQQAQRYIEHVQEWFTSAAGDFEHIGEMLMKELELGLPEEEIKQEIETLRNLTEIVRWYQHQIYVKIMRALQGTYDSFEIEDPVQNDANGSAKVALTGIDRSISAFGGMLRYFPEQEDQILALLVLLEQIRRHVETAFPHARPFHRPGFDD